MRTEQNMELWGGIECTVNRVGDRFHDQFAKSGHLSRPEDLDLVAGLGIKTLRYPVQWERIAPDRPDQRDWSFADERLARLQTLGIDPIVGLVHHGSGPRYTDLLDDGFAPGLADHARAVAERYPWIEAYTPVNEPLTTARFSALYGHWYPHATDGLSFARALLNQVRATVLSMEAIRRVSPEARLVQTDDLGMTHATEPLMYQADFDNERRWLGWDLLCGRVDREHRMWEELTAVGIEERELGWFLDHACPPDVIGVNYYLTSERFIDHRLDRYPPHTYGSNAYEEYADLEAVRVLAGGVAGPAHLLNEAWQRYRLPLAITECHLGCTREEQVRWLRYVWDEAARARTEGADVRAVTVWSLFGAHDWCSLLTAERNRYEPGVFDLRAPEPRPTALAGAVAALTQGRAPEETGEGWWERPVRLLYPPVLAASLPSTPSPKRRVESRPILFVGRDEVLTEEFARLCDLRGLSNVQLASDGREPLVVSDVQAALDQKHPWAVVMLGERGLDAVAAGDLAARCRERSIRLVAFSSPAVFDGLKTTPYLESDPVRPLCARGYAEAALEEAILERLPSAMIVRAGSLFGSGDGTVAAMLKAVLDGKEALADSEGFVSPTYVPDLIHATLDLLIDGFEGIVHLTNVGEVSHVEFAQRLAQVTGRDELRVARPSQARRPSSALRSERAWIMPTLDDAIERTMPGLLAEVGDRLQPYLS